MGRVDCPEYQRLLKEYDRVFRRWAEQNAESAERERLEEKHRKLVDRQQHCSICAIEFDLFRWAMIVPTATVIIDNGVITHWQG